MHSGVKADLFCSDYKYIILHYVMLFFRCVLNNFILSPTLYISEWNLIRSTDTTPLTPLKKLNHAKIIPMIGCRDTGSALPGC